VNSAQLPYRTFILTTLLSNLVLIPIVHAEDTDHKDNPTVLSTIKIQATGKDDNTNEVDGYVSKTATIGLGGAKHSLKEIANSISVITREKMDDVNAITFDDVLRYTPGLSIKSFGTDSVGIESRGYGIDHFQIDGVSSSARVNENNFALVMYERMEVMRGAAGLLQGTGDPGGTINFVRKRAEKDFGLNAKTSMGSWNNYSKLKNMSYTWKYLLNCLTYA